MAVSRSIDVSRCFMFPVTGRLPKELWRLNMIQAVKLRGTKLSGGRR